MSNMTKTMAVFSGSAHPELAREIANALGVELGDIHLEKFANGEIYARYNDSIPWCGCILDSVGRGRARLNDALMELSSWLMRPRQCFWRVRSRRSSLITVIRAKIARLQRASPSRRSLWRTCSRLRGRSHHHDRSSSGPDPGLLRYSGQSYHGALDHRRLLQQERPRF